jgi:hypothetical protein
MVGRDGLGDPQFPFRGDGRDDRVFATGEVVVVGPWRDPGSLGDVVDAHIARPAFQGQAKGSLSQGLLGGLPLSGAQPGPV